MLPHCYFFFKRNLFIYVVIYLERERVHMHTRVGDGAQEEKKKSQADWCSVLNPEFNLMTLR